MANDPTQIQQPGPNDLDVIQHPTLGKLSFPKTMGASDRNDLIQQMESDYKTQASQPGAMQTKPGGPITQAPAGASTSTPDKSGVWNSIKEFGSGLLDPIKSLPESGVSMLRDWPEKPMEQQSDYLTRAKTAIKSGDPIAWLGHMMNATLAPTMIPQTIESLNAMDSPARASGNILSLTALAKAPEIAEGATEIPGKIREAALGDPDAAALKGLHVPARSPKTQSALTDIQGARPYLKGATSQADIQSRIQAAKDEIWQPYSDALQKVGGNTVKGPDGPDTVANLEKERLKTSAQLQAARSMKPTDLQTAMQKDQQIKALTDRDAAIKSAIDPELSSTGIDPSKIRETFGNVKGVERRVSGKSTVAEAKQPSGLGRMKNIDVTKPTTWLGEPGKGARDIAAGRPLWSAKPTDQAIKEGFSSGGDKPNLVPNQPMPPGQRAGGVPPTGPIRGLLPAAPTPLGPAPDTSGTPPGYRGPGYQPLAENRQLPPRGGTSGPATSAGPGEGVSPANPAASSGRIAPSPIPIPETTPGPIAPPSRQLPAAGATTTGRQLSSEVQAPKVGTQPLQPPQMRESPPQATVSPYLTGKHEFSIIPADSPSQRAISMRELRSQGYHPQVIRGNYNGQPGASVFVPDMPTHEALDFQSHMTSTYGHPAPDSIITKQGLVNVARKTTTPIDFSKTIFGPDALTKPSHSIASGGGEDMPFALNPSNSEIPLKAPYEGEHHSNSTIKSGGSLLGSKRGAIDPDTGTAAGAEADRIRKGNGAPGGSYFYDKGTLADPNIAARKHVYTTGQTEKSIATIEDTPIWHQTAAKAFQDARSQGLDPKEAHHIATNEAEHALMNAGYDGYRSKVHPGSTFLFGDNKIFKPGEEPEPPQLTPHPNAPEPRVQPAPPTPNTNLRPTGPASSPKKFPSKGPVKSPASQPATKGAAVTPTTATAPLPPARPEGINASGESSASLEAINRVGSEKAQNVKRFRVDTRSGRETPLFGVDAVDAKPQPYEVIVQRGPKGEVVLDQGPRAQYRGKNQ